jgi:hypothetical protein
MNNYYKIFIYSLILLIISIINEKLYPLTINSSYNKKFIYILIIRWFHYFVYLYSTFYLFFFNGIGNQFDINLFLFISLIINSGWFFFSACNMSYLELLFYNVSLENIPTTFHPTFNTLFYNFTPNILFLSGLLYILNVNILLYFSKSMNLISKFIYYGIFVGLLFHVYYFTKLQIQYYSSNNKLLLAIKNIYNKFIKN